MKRQHLLYLSIGLVLMIVAAIFYQNSPAPIPEMPSASVETASFKATSPAAPASTSPSESDEPVAARIASATPAPTRDGHPSATAPVIPENFSTGPKQPWEKEIVGLVNRLDMTDQAKVEKLLSRFNSLPPAGRILAMDHATKLIPDEDYAKMRPVLFSMASSSPELREVVLLDVLTRSEPVRMPTLVEMLRLPKNPEQEEVREILLAYLDVDYGNDVGGWDSAVKKFLADNPDL